MANARIILAIGISKPTGANRGIPLWVMDDTYGQAACDEKGEEPLEKGQAEPAQAPCAKRKLTGQKHIPKKKKTATKPPAAQATTGRDSGKSDEEEEDEEEEEEEETSPAKRPKKTAQKSETNEATGGDRGTISPSNCIKRATCKAGSEG